MCARPLLLQGHTQATYMDALTKYNYMCTPAQTSHARSHTVPLMPVHVLCTFAVVLSQIPQISIVTFIVCMHLHG